MKFFGKTGASVTVAAVAVTGFLAATMAPALATPQFQIYTASSGVKTPAALIGPNGEKPTEWGVVAVPLDSSALSRTPMASESVGGGTWSYGTSTTTSGQKRCYSNYIHPTKKHSASIAIASQTDKDIREKDIWAKAAGVAGPAHTCYTYWGKY
ncbi:lactococcin 972 family bacteriocin [Streptomyces sp. NPDC057438]|uniref:lactococcin 972 family bacteriocin n=1 Tax=Streptomyces sp. NPDC057438 TaxID=3346133 RepID=UPI00368DC913